MRNVVQIFRVFRITFIFSFVWSGVTGIAPSIVGIVCNIIAMTIGTKMTTVTEEEKEERSKLFIIPETESDMQESRKTMNSAKMGM